MAGKLNSALRRLGVGASAVREDPAHLVLVIDYTNHRGERALRRVVPQRIWFGSTPWHPEKQWLMEAFDLDRQAQRDFALTDIQGLSGEAAEEGEPDSVPERPRHQAAAG